MGDPPEWVRVPVVIAGVGIRVELYRLDGFTRPGSEDGAYAAYVVAAPEKAATRGGTRNE